jgi:DNA modification methylase
MASCRGGATVILYRSESRVAIEPFACPATRGKTDRVAKLVWKGKLSGGARAVPEGPPVPIRTDEVHGEGPPGEPNRFVFGDSALALPALVEELSGQVDLVYVDPPFDTGAAFDVMAAIPGAPVDAPRVAVRAYEDARGLDAWLAWFFDTVRRLECLLARGGSLYVHLDAHAAHYAKVILDEVFGQHAFQREIIWRIGWISGFKTQARGWIRNHDTLLYYAKGGRPKTFHKELIPYAQGYLRRDGSPPRGTGYPMEDVWNASPADRLDSIQIKSFSGEKVGYPTQKNEALLERIVRASSSPGDLVLDCFVGSGTTAVVAEKLGRRWIVGDLSPLALHTTRKRLLALPVACPWRVESVGMPASFGSEGGLRTVTRVSGMDTTIELAGFTSPSPAIPARVRDAVTHWSQWLEGWCVDWDHQGGPVRVGSSAWREKRFPRPLVLSLGHRYERPGSYVASVKVFDFIGGTAATTIPIDAG